MYPEDPGYQHYLEQLKRQHEATAKLQEQLAAREQLYAEQYGTLPDNWGIHGPDHLDPMVDIAEEIASMSDTFPVDWCGAADTADAFLRMLADVRTLPEYGS